MYVARVAMGADPQQTLTAFREAEAYDGPSLVIAYSHCIAHGIDMRKGLDQQYRAVASGHWPLVRYDPAMRGERRQPVPCSTRPGRASRSRTTSTGELRYRMPAQRRPRPRPSGCSELAQEAVDQRWQTYEEMATRGADAVRRRRPEEDRWT